MAILKVKVDLDKFVFMDYVYTNRENGKSTITFDIVERKEVGQYGDTHFVQVSKRMPDGTYAKTIVGNARPLGAESPQPQPQAPVPSFATQAAAMGWQKSQDDTISWTATSQKVNHPQGKAMPQEQWNPQPQPQPSSEGDLPF